MTNQPKYYATDDGVVHARTESRDTIFAVTPISQTSHADAERIARALQLLDDVEALENYNGRYVFSWNVAQRHLSVGASEYVMDIDEKFLEWFNSVPDAIHAGAEWIRNQEQQP